MQNSVNQCFLTVICLLPVSGQLFRDGKTEKNNKNVCSNVQSWKSFCDVPTGASSWFVIIRDAPIDRLLIIIGGYLVISWRFQ